MIHDAAPRPHPPLWRDFLGFIRFNIAFFLGAVGVVGHISFHAPALLTGSVFLCSFMLVASSYAYNNLRDREEDLINHGRLSPFVQYPARGAACVLALFALGCIFAEIIGPTTVAAYLLLSALGFVYSHHKIKRIPLVKNVYTALLAGVYLIGASAGGTLTMVMLQYALLYACIFFIGSLLSDLRDFKGDFATGIRTLPVVFGYEKIKLGVMGLANLFFLIVVGLGLRPFYLFSFFMVPVIEFVSMGEARRAHKMIQYMLLLGIIWWLK